MLFKRNNKSLTPEQVAYLLKDISAAVQEKEVIRLRQQLNCIHNNEFGSNAKTTKIHPPIRYAAASVVFIIISSVVMFNSNKTDRNELFQSNYKTYSSTFKVRSAEKSSDIKDNAIYFYENKEFEKSAALFKEITLNAPDKIAAHFYLAISYMENKQFELAIETLQYVKATDNFYFSEQAEWYLSLCYIITKKDNQALEILEKVAESESYYSKQAAVLVKQIKKLKN